MVVTRAFAKHGQFDEQLFLLPIQGLSSTHERGLEHLFPQKGKVTKMGEVLEGSVECIRYLDKTSAVEGSIDLRKY